MTPLIWSPRAVADLEELRAYIEADAPAWADLTIRRLVAAVERLEQFPDSGRTVPERKSDGRIVIGEVVHDSLVPLPFESEGLAVIVLRLVNGDSTELARSKLAVEALGTARYIEELPSEFKPEGIS